MRFCDFKDEPRIVPSAERLRCRHVNCSFSLGTGNRNGEVGLTGRAVDVCVSGDEKSVCDGRTEGLDYSRVYFSPAQRIFVNLGGFYCAEYD